MRCMLGLAAVGLLMLLTSAGGQDLSWQPVSLEVADTWVMTEPGEEPAGTLYLYIQYARGKSLFTKTIWLGVDFPGMELGCCYVASHVPVLDSEVGLWEHWDKTPKCQLSIYEGPSMWVDGYTHSRYVAKYVVLKRDEGWLLLPSGPSEYEMFSKARPIPVSANTLNLYVVNQDVEHDLLYLVAPTAPNGALFRAAIESPDFLHDGLPEGAILERSQREFHTIAFDTTRNRVVADFASPDFLLRYGQAGVLYGIDSKRQPWDTLVIRKLDNPSQIVSSQVLPLRAGEDIETVYPWKPGQLIVVTKQSVYTFGEATAKLTYLLDLVKPAQDAIAKELAEEKLDQASEQEEAPAQGAGEP